MSLLIMARGAQVSRAAREYIVRLSDPVGRPARSELVEPVRRALHPIWDLPDSSLQFLTSIHVTCVTSPGLFIRQDYGMG